MTLINSHIAAARPSFLGYLARLLSHTRHPAPPQPEPPKPRIRNPPLSQDVAIRLHNAANGARLR